MSISLCLCYVGQSTLEEDGETRRKKNVNIKPPRYCHHTTQSSQHSALFSLGFAQPGKYKCNRCELLSNTMWHMARRSGIQLQIPHGTHYTRCSCECNCEQSVNTVKYKFVIITIIEFISIKFHFSTGYTVLGFGRPPP